MRVTVGAGGGIGICAGVDFKAYGDATGASSISQTKFLEPKRHEEQTLRIDSSNILIRPCMIHYQKALTLRFLNYHF